RSSCSLPAVTRWLLFDGRRSAGIAEPYPLPPFSDPACACVFEGPSRRVLSTGHRGPDVRNYVGDCADPYQHLHAAAPHPALHDCSAAAEFTERGAVDELSDDHPSPPRDSAEAGLLERNSGRLHHPGCRSRIAAERKASAPPG